MTLRHGAGSTGRGQRVLLGVLAFGLVAAPMALAQEPPSFALWAAHWDSYSDAVLQQPKDKCAVFAKRNDDLRTGKCVVAVLLKSYPGLIAQWRREVAAIAKSQKSACRVAIRAYARAAGNAFSAFSVYFRGHRNTPVTQINQDSHDEPLATLNALHDEAQSHAVRVCG